MNMKNKWWLFAGLLLIGIAMLLSLSGCSSFYVESGLSAQDRGEYRVETFDHVEEQHSGILETGERYRATTDAQNPYGRLAMGFEIESAHRVTFNVNLAHVSSLETKNDHGLNSLNFSVRWHPFAN
jgi:hypothetical protein